MLGNLYFRRFILAWNSGTPFWEKSPLNLVPAAECGHPLRHIRDEIRERLDYIPAQFPGKTLRPPTVRLPAYGLRQSA
ncbi:hypothetical protein DP152_21130 [Salmonella enterica subsp. enterica serovar Typhimurium]|nr:hypothetical protein [Salmonella enterica]TQS51532.1 hypothetical protein DSB74_04185 [Salmonella enterica subsp. enterica serovar Typhimurium]TQS61602.1 hypothetical protein DSB72_12405 [Salmonella enterica subsp. enterica serovar Typhimurium]TQS69440.1 hypothetical protein DSB75_02400 [Salmonella enterica subsp. enterica serovar Typhimurium]TXC14204.1 hypothetical protein DP152_21130 [Salmonella enterica subsp. enterica serovar Typhimurium]